MDKQVKQDPPFPVGCYVQHPVHGQGVVKEVGEKHLEILFDTGPDPMTGKISDKQRPIVRFDRSVEARIQKIDPPSPKATADKPAQPVEDSHQHASEHLKHKTAPEPPSHPAKHQPTHPPAHPKKDHS